jgi:hypothetical protein
MDLIYDISKQKEHINAKNLLKKPYKKNCGSMPYFLESSYRN